MRTLMHEEISDINKDEYEEVVEVQYGKVGVLLFSSYQNKHGFTFTL